MSEASHWYRFYYITNMTDNEKEKELFRLLQHSEPKRPQVKKLSDEAAKKIADVLHIMLKDK